MSQTRANTTKNPLENFSKIKVKLIFLDYRGALRIFFMGQTMNKIYYLTLSLRNLFIFYPNSLRTFLLL